MKSLTLRTLPALALAALLAACGGPLEETPAQGAASVQTGSAITTVPVSTATGTGTGSTSASSASVSSAAPNMPTPDCAADGCNSPRIIDGNAEAFRYAAMQRAAEPAA